MIMNRLLLIIWCVKSTSENLLTPLAGSGLSANLGLSLPTKLNDFSLEWPMTVKTDIVRRSTAKPGTSSTTSKTQNAAQNAYKNEYGYSISEVYDSQTQNRDNNNNNNDVGKQPSSSTVPDTQLLYHSFSNPLFKSNSLNIEPHGDIHKISSPFKSSWIFSPTFGRLAEKRSGNSSSSGSNFKGGTGSPGVQHDSNMSPTTNFSLKFSDNFTLSSANTSSPFDLPEGNSSSFLSPAFDKLETFDDIAPPSFTIDDVVASTTTTTTQPLTQKSFFGYNFKEVTSNGKTRGRVQVFGNEGVEKNVEYNELTKPSNITKLLSNITTTPVQKTQPQSKSVSTPKTTTAKPSNRTSTAKPIAESTTQGSELPRHIIIEDVHPLTREFSYDQPIASDFATPEFILYDFLGQLQSFPGYVPADNFDDNRYATFDELVSENTFVYRKR